MKHHELCDRLDRHADRLTDRVLGEMYRNPFWQERFGERAQKHGRQDGRFHIDYLIQALGSDDAAIIEHYARWLQQVLTTRGMCSRHLAENFDRLGTAIAHEEWPEGARAVSMLRSASAALVYPAGVARRIQELAPSIAAAAANVLHARHPEWGDRDRCLDDLRYHLAYAADALALGMPSVFLSYVTWIAEFLERHHVPRAHLVESLEVLAAVPDAPAELHALLAEAQHSLAS